MIKSDPGSSTISLLRYASKILLAGLVVLMTGPGILARVVNVDDAQVAAENWLSVIIQSKGGWGDLETAQVDHIEPYEISGETVGYIVHIAPQGFLAISAFRELPPIKAYSTVDDFNLDCDFAGFEIIKRALEHSYDFMTKMADSLGVDRQRGDIIDSRYVETWDRLMNQPETMIRSLGRGVARGDYQEGEILLEDSWNQSPPYNDWCPEADTACTLWYGFFPDSNSWENSPFYNENAWAGCVAVSGSQVMRYWGWPPRGVGDYTDGWDWANMKDEYEWEWHLSDYFTFYDENNVPVTQTQVNAVAELMREVGREVEMDYGCDGSSAYVYVLIGASLQNALKNTFRFYEGILYAPRVTFFDWEWWDLITEDISLNRPLPYGFSGHAFTVDGWENVSSEFIHVNYGHGPDATCDGHLKNFWYGLTDDICGHEPYEQKMLIHCYPQYSLGKFLMGTYETYGSFQYRYFDQDAFGTDADFEAGQFLQFHNTGSVKCSGSGSEAIRFIGLGTTTSRTFLYTRGDKSKGIELSNGGVVRLRNDGGLRFF